jgi:Flp pilus assembly protein TadG
MIEFALVASLFLIFLFGIMDWAWVFFQHQTIMWRASDAARWIAATRFDTNVARDIVLCGTAGCGGTDNTGFLQSATVDTSLVTASDTIDSLTTVKRYYVQVSVTGYRVEHFTPFLSTSYTAKPITATQPMECLNPSGDCWVP